MIAALFYLQWHTVKNRLTMRFKRLKQPKYLFGALVGGLYFYWYVFRVLLAPRGHNYGAAAVTTASPTDLLFYESVGALVLFVFIVLAWVLPHQRAALAFSEAEVAFLFPAPVTRRTLIHFKLMRSQFGILFSALFLTLLSSRFGANGHWLLRAAGFWVILFTLNLHILGASFAITLLMDRGISTWKRRVAVLLPVIALAGVLARTHLSATHVRRPHESGHDQAIRAAGLRQRPPALFVVSVPTHHPPLPGTRRVRVSDRPRSGATGDAVALSLGDPLGRRV
jgi:hypothetical protein